MIDLKVAQSIQQDYRQAAADHRFIKEHNLKSQLFIRPVSIVPIITLIALVIIFI